MSRIVWIILATMVSLLGPTKSSAQEFKVAKSHYTHSTLPATSDTEATFNCCYSKLVSTPPSAPLSQSVVPASRTLSRSARYDTRQFQHLKAPSLIDSTTAASRYGLYNHKILFVSHARQHYLLRLVRLII